MPSAFSRLRLWFGISALLMIGVVAGFYVYARYRVHKAVHDLPARLGINIQQNTNGFTYSQAVGGRTIFSITASNAIRYKEGDKAELHNVKIVSYGRDSDRLDEISGDEFEYDAQSGDVVAKGDAAIELQAVEAGTSGPGKSPKKIGTAVHLETIGLTFNQKTGIAHTAEKIDFQLPQAAGSAVGATYDSKQNALHLYSDIHLVTGGPKSMNLKAATAVYLQEERELTLTDLRVTSGIRHMEAQQAVVHLRDDNTVERADASGGVNLQVQGQRTAQLHAPDADVLFAPDNKARSARLSGGVTWDTQGANASRGSAGRVQLAFGADNEIKSAELRDSVDLAQLPAVQSGPQSGAEQSPAANAQGTEFRGDGLDLQVAGGTSLQTANSVGSAQILLSNAQAGTASGSPTTSTSSPGSATRMNGRTVITASRFDAKFAPDNRISVLAGSAPVKIVSSAPGQTDRVSESDELLATFSPGKTQTLQDVIQNGNVQIQEGQRTAGADRATFNQASDSMTLSGNVRYKDASQGASLTSNELALNRSTGETTATGDVKTTYAEQKAQASGAILSSSQAVHVTAGQMVEKNQTGTARYSGAARLWQGGNIVQAPTIELSRKEGTLDAQSAGSARVSTVFVQADKNGKQAPMEVTSDHLHYEDSQRKAFFNGAVVGRTTDSTLRAQEAVITLRPQAQKAAKPKTAATNAPSEVQAIDATGNILLQQPGRRAIGSHLLYIADDEKFVLTGTPGAPPSIFDAEHGQVTGVSLTFFNRDDRVLVDSSNSTSITQTRLKK